MTDKLISCASENRKDFDDLVANRKVLDLRDGMSPADVSACVKKILDAQARTNGRENLAPLELK